MERLIYGGDEFHRLYNCSFYNVSDIPLEQRRNIPLGVAEIVVGTMEFLLYIPCMVSIWWNRELSCYKFLFVMGLMDMANLLILGPITGYFTLSGSVYCSHPILIYVLGSVGSGLINGEKILEVMLALNRLLYFTSERFARKLFSKNPERTWAYTIPPVMYMFLFIMFGQPALFSGKVNMWTWNPHHGYAPELNKFFVGEYKLLWYTLNEYFVMIFLPIIYIIFIVFVKKQRQMILSDDPQFIDPTAAFVQVLMISFINFASCLLFVINNYITTDTQILITIHIWLCMQVHGLPPVIYLFLNDTIQENFLTMLEMMINKFF